VTNKTIIPDITVYTASNPHLPFLLVYEKYSGWSAYYAASLVVGVGHPRKYSPDDPQKYRGLMPSTISSKQERKLFETRTPNKIVV
jgi:hypothetical protein